ncbi:MAG: PhnD/SsuA/transferrin family substrate-binding protein [gamma proteobacterium symbiont of Bathyaustriella thionipta]|nr:PhnD/SsuA/transferrin family substrate-binding protein [gamma proteobacterium symbiont of Bathyaustriella thionipta]MCU7953132.1 PhnD/SsuA/transferrin family substrate-binding protein [gamma proteobacterium symbiont of Bathyaustriella thionipta]MCU7968215.1 PhnD/SsuA/transferrin family substrate-binding protein [gamma proteobacterium symbiont of Bathyaustriella thionipta]
MIIGILTHDRSISLENPPWKLSFSRLNQHPDYHFSPRFLTIEQLNDSLQNDELDFIICDALNYLMLESKYDILRLLTRTEQYSDSFIASEALSVYTLSNNSGITQLSDLKNKNLGILDDNSSISWLFLEKFLSKHELIINDNVHIKTITNISLFLALLHSRQVDAIVSKSGLIEQYLSKEQIDGLKLINPRRGWQAPFLHSSILIPEWPIAKAWFIDDELANQVTTLLLHQFNNDSNETTSYFSRQYQWAIAQNYNTLENLFFLSEETDVPINSDLSSFSPKIQYWVSFIIICFLVIILILYLRSSKDLNNRLTLSKESLEQEIKERQHAQEQALNHQAELAHVARLSTMGEMASGLAHELNQPLSAINTYVQGCIRRINMGTDDSAAIINALQLTTQQAERAAGIIRRLRSFVRKGESHKTYSEINHLVNEVTHFLETQLKERKVSLKLELEDNLPPVLADIIQVEQVLINLLKNAIEAMSDIESPTILVSTRLFNHNLIELCVIDSGHGISEDKLKRIFNPFFTTKSSGMGMGLSISSSIIEAHDGKLYAQNNADQGARFCFTLPITEQPGNNNE